jgi:hypothetical protein
MQVVDLLDQARLRLDDMAEPYLWSDDELLGYLSRAEEEAAIRASLLRFDTREASPVIAPIAVVAGTREYALDARVLRLDRAWLQGGPFRLALVSEDQMERSCGSDWETLTGTPDTGVLWGTQLRLVPIPQAASTLHLSGYRLPSGPLALDGEAPEIAPSLHLDLLDWALHLAYLKNDAETLNREKAADAAGRFERVFGPRLTADQYRKRSERRARTVLYAGY